MQNKIIADILNRMGTLLEIKGELIFKIRSYYKAAENINNLSADVRILDLAEIGPLSTKEIRQIKSQSTEEPKDKRILELEARVQILENEKFNLEKEVMRLNGIVSTLQDELKKMTDEFLITIQNQFNWFQSKIGN